jgi:type III pantothenate kinase
VGTNLAVDIGNTLVKAGIFKEGRLVTTRQFAGNALKEELDSLTGSYAPDRSIVSASGEEHDVTAFIQHIPFMRLEPGIRLPFNNRYATPYTLGMDRVATVAGAQSRMPGRNVLIIDMGTCITYDLLTAEGDYVGGAISPGWRMRLRAMHEFTKRLPLADAVSAPDIIGTDTLTCLQSGAWHGVAAEIYGVTEEYTRRYENLCVMATGGDCAQFDKHIKSNIFAAPHLVLEGLNQILEFNVQ